MVLQRLKLIITFNQDFQGVESTSDMTQFSQNINKNTQKKQNSLRQLRFWQFTFHSPLFSTWHWQLSLTKQAEKWSRHWAKKWHQTTINKQLRPTVKSVSCWESANQLQRMSGRLSQSILLILFQKYISGPLSLVENENNISRLSLIDISNETTLCKFLLKFDPPGMKSSGSVAWRPKDHEFANDRHFFRTTCRSNK